MEKPLKRCLYLDDLRTPTKTMPGYKPWAIVRNYEEFVNYIRMHGIPDYISFDHDLADEHYTPQEYWHDYELSKAYQESKEYTEKTGLDCAKFLCDFSQEYGLKLGLCNVHSANPVGADNICHYINNYKKFMGWEEDCYYGVPDFEIADEHQHLGL